MCCGFVAFYDYWTKSVSFRKALLCFSCKSLLVMPVLVQTKFIELVVGWY